MSIIQGKFHEMHCLKPCKSFGFIAAAESEHGSSFTDIWKSQAWSTRLSLDSISNLKVNSISVGESRPDAAGNSAESDLSRQFDNDFADISQKMSLVWSETGQL